MGTSTPLRFAPRQGPSSKSYTHIENMICILLMSALDSMSSAHPQHRKTAEKITFHTSCRFCVRRVEFSRLPLEHVAKKFVVGTHHDGLVALFCLRRRLPSRLAGRVHQRTAQQSVPRQICFKARTTTPLLAGSLLEAKLLKNQTSHSVERTRLIVRAKTSLATYPLDQYVAVLPSRATAPSRRQSSCN